MKIVTPNPRTKPVSWWLLYLGESPASLSFRTGIPAPVVAAIIRGESGTKQRDSRLKVEAVAAELGLPLTILETFHPSEVPEIAHAAAIFSAERRLDKPYLKATGQGRRRAAAEEAAGEE